MRMSGSARNSRHGFRLRAASVSLGSGCGGDIFRARGAEGDTITLQCGGVVGVGWFDVADVSPEFAVEFARERSAAGTFVDPGLVAVRLGLARLTRDVGGGAAARMVV